MNQKSTIQTTLLSAGIAGLLVVGLGASSTSEAVIYSSNAASGMCKAASGPGAAVFFFSALYAQNTSASTQFLTCALSDPGHTTSGRAITNVNMHLDNPNAAAVNFTCVVQLHHFGASTTSAVYQIPGTANNNHIQANFSSASTPAIPTRGSSDQFYTMSCAMPAGTRLVSIDTVMSET